jgi:hypothetical protein
MIRSWMLPASQPFPASSHPDGAGSDRPTVHAWLRSPGVGSAPTADRLKAVVAPTHTPALNWRSTFEDQGHGIQAQPSMRACLSPPSPSATAMAASSHGRSKVHLVGGIVTIGTPHGGAPVRHMLMWSFNAQSYGALSRVVNAFFRW